MAAGTCLTAGIWWQGPGRGDLAAGTCLTAGTWPWGPGCGDLPGCGNLPCRGDPPGCGYLVAGTWLQGPGRGDRGRPKAPQNPAAGWGATPGWPREGAHGRLLGIQTGRRRALGRRPWMSPSLEWPHKDGRGGTEGLSQPPPFHPHSPPLVALFCVSKVPLLAFCPAPAATVTATPSPAWLGRVLPRRAAGVGGLSSQPRLATQDPGTSLPAPPHAPHSATGLEPPFSGRSLSVPEPPVSWGLPVPPVPTSQVIKVSVGRSLGLASVISGSKGGAGSRRGRGHAPWTLRTH